MWDRTGKEYPVWQYRSKKSQKPEPDHGVQIMTGFHLPNWWSARSAGSIRGPIMFVRTVVSTRTEKSSPKRKSDLNDSR